MKVFRIHKLIEANIRLSENREDLIEGLNLTITALQSGWPQKLEGLTKQECLDTGLLVSDNWLEEVPAPNLKVQRYGRWWWIIVNLDTKLALHKKYPENDQLLLFRTKKDAENHCKKLRGEPIND